jgi:hypothetical protein
MKYIKLRHYLTNTVGITTDPQLKQLQQTATQHQLAWALPAINAEIEP